MIASLTHSEQQVKNVNWLRAQRHGIFCVGVVAAAIGGVVVVVRLFHVVCVVIVIVCLEC